MRFDIDDTKYIILLIDAIIEIDEQGQLCPQTKEDLILQKKYLKKKNGGDIDVV